MAKLNPQQRKEVQRTQPKMVRVVDGRTGKARMVVAELSEVEKTKRRADFTAAGQQADNTVDGFVATR